jgi:hypothetical protein
MRILIFTIIFGIIVFSFQTTASHPSPEPPPPIGDYVIDDFTPYPVPDIPKPIKGVSFKDPLLHTELLKVIDAQSDFSPTTRMAYLGWVRHDAESPDATKWLVQSTKSPAGHLFNAIPPYSKIRDFPSTIMASFDPDFRWHHTDSNILYVTYSSKFAKYAVDTGVITDLHDFKSDFPGLAIARVYAKEGGNPSIDSRYWGWVVRCYDATHSPTWWNDSLIVYDKDANGIDNGGIICRLPATDPKFHNPTFIGISPGGDYVLVDVLGSGKFYVYPRDFSTVREIPCAIASAVHAFPGVALDDKGREVIVWVEKHPTLPDYWVVMADIATGEKTYLVSFGSSPNFNASGVSYQKPGWAVVSGTKTAGTAPISWSDGEIFIVQLTKNPKPKLWRIVQTHVNRVDHSDDLFAKPNKKGTKIFFRSNWGTPYSSGGIIDAYQINLPSTWYQDLKGSNSMILMTHSLPEVMIGSSYSQTLQIIGGSSPYTWSITSGTLPNGLLLNPSTGVISGTPTTPGTFSFTVQVKDSTPQTTALNLSVKVRSSDTTPPPTPKGAKIIK